MLKLKSLVCALFLVFLFSCVEEKKELVWQDLFNGKDLSGWKSNENDSSFQVVDGVLVASGSRSHLFYVGEDGNASFKNFELEAEIKTTNLANSGIYFHTQWQEEGWPEKGMEAQVNVSHKGAGDYREVKKGGSLYSLRNVYKAFADDSVWYTMNLKVEGNRIRISIDDLLLVDYTQPINPVRFRAEGQDVLNRGTFALQCHDPESEVLFRSIKIKVLPDDRVTPNIPDTDSYTEILKHQSNHIAFIDYGVSVGNSTELNKYLTAFYASGINLGILSEKGANLTTDSSPVFVGKEIFVEDETPTTDDLQGIDYTIGEVPKLDDQKTGKYVDFLVDYLSSGRIDILKNIEELPAKQLNQVLVAAQNNNVAIAISEKENAPSIELIMAAKAKGCQFATVDMISESGDISVEYFNEVIEKAKLDYKDIYIADRYLDE